MEQALKVKILSRHRQTFLERIYIMEVVRGLVTTLRHLLRNLAGTLTGHDRIRTFEYPEMSKPIPDGYRAEHRLMQREDGSVRCTACMLCATACPAQCIEIVAGESPDPNVEKFATTYNINLLRCVFCGLCVEACPCDAIRMDTKKVDMAGYTREEFVLDINYLLKNHPEGMSPYSVAVKAGAPSRKH